MDIKLREINKEVYQACINEGYPEIVSRIIAGRTNGFNKNILNPSSDFVEAAKNMADSIKSSQRIVNSIQTNQTILLFTDYDVDGCASMAIFYGALHDVFGVKRRNIQTLTGHRTEDGYGLTDTIANKIEELHPNLVITADVGISDGPRIDRLAKAGIDVIVTDHHLLPLEGVPMSACAVINPQRQDCQYDNDIAGCGVAWLLMTAVSRELGSSMDQKRILHQFLDYVALGTVADLVSLASPTNRYFVRQGLRFMNEQKRECWRVALDGRKANVGFLGYQLGPRINASSRMTGEANVAINFLISKNPDEISAAYQKLNHYNDNRRKIEKQMFDTAKEQINKNDNIFIGYDESYDPGIQGIVASKLTETFGIPAIMLADLGDDLVAGSGRSGKFLHFRDALQSFDDNYPGILVSFGGHKAAAGLKIHKKNIEILQKGLSDTVNTQLAGQDTTLYIKTDGSLKEHLNFDTYHQIEALNPFGMGFPSPIFSDVMTATDVRVVGKNPVHLSMKLDGIKAIQFNALNNPGDSLQISSNDKVDVIYTLSVDEWQGRKSLQLIVKKISKREC
jgi:single-stranded-DNA-specific exonuclease